MKENQELKTIQATLSRLGVKHQCLSPEELKQRLPSIRLTKGEMGLLEESGGVLYAAKALRVLQVMLCSVRGNATPDLGTLGPSQSFHTPLPPWMRASAMLALVLTFGEGSFIYPARSCQCGEEF